MQTSTDGRAFRVLEAAEEHDFAPTLKKVTQIVRDVAAVEIRT